jgi:hypothetical protein
MGEIIKVRRKLTKIEALRFEGPDWLPFEQRIDFYNNKSLMQLCSGVNLRIHQVGTVTHGGPDQYGLFVLTRRGILRVVEGNWIVKENKELSVLTDKQFQTIFEPLISGMR